MGNMLPSMRGWDHDGRHDPIPLIMKGDQIDVLAQNASPNYLSLLRVVEKFMKHVPSRERSGYRTQPVMTASDFFSGVKQRASE